jgi:hypothetical protein
MSKQFEELFSSCDLCDAIYGGQLCLKGNELEETLFSYILYWPAAKYHTCRSLIAACRKISEFPPPFGPTTLFDNSNLVDITALPNRQIRVSAYRLQIDHPGMYLDIEIYTIPPGIMVSPHSPDYRFALIFSHSDPRTIFDL